MKTPPPAKVPSKTMSILAYFLAGATLNRFEAEPLGDHCLNSTISELRIPHHPATQSTLIWPGIPRPSGHLFHGHPAGQSERSDAGVALLV